MSRARPFVPRTVALSAVAVVVLAACSSDDDNGGAITAPPDPSPMPVTPVAPVAASADSVTEALAGVPDALFARFALGEDAISANEAFRRVDVDNGQAVNTTWGIEGAADDESRELEVRYAEDGTVVQTVQGALVESLPADIESALRAIYPDAPIEEIERVSIDGVPSWTVVLDVEGVEVEPNFDDAGELLFTEFGIEADEVPESSAAVFDQVALTGGAALPEAGYERLENVDGSVFYSVEFEDDGGRSLTIETTESGEVIRVEHEDALANLSSSESVEEAVANFPPTIEAQFAADYPEVTANEIFRSLERTASAEPRWGIEGVSDDESLGIEAIYSSDGSLLSVSRERVLDTLPDVVQMAFDDRYPGAEIEEIEEASTDEGTSYAIVFVVDDEESEANFDTSGAFLALEDALDEDEVPEAVLQSVGGERIGLPILEIEAIDSVDGTRRYDAEYENESGDSISYSMDADGTIVSTEHETAL